MGLFRSSKRESAESSPSSSDNNRARAASLNRFGFRRHRVDKGDEGGGGGLTFSRRRSPKSVVEERRRSGDSTEPPPTIRNKGSEGCLTLRRTESPPPVNRSNDTHRPEVTFSLLPTRKDEEEEEEDDDNREKRQSSTKQSENAAETTTAAAGTTPSAVRKSRGTTKPSVRMASHAADRESDKKTTEEFVEKRWRTKSSPMAVSVRDPAGFSNVKVPDEATQLTPRGGGSIIKVSNEVVTVRPSAVKQAEQKKPIPNRRVSINAADKMSSREELDSPRYVPKKGGVVKTVVMQKVSPDNFDNHNSIRKYPQTARAAIQVEPDPTPKVVRKLRQWPPPPPPRQSSPAQTVATAPASMIQDLDDEEFETAASPAASDGSTVASPVAKDIETRKELSQSAAKLGFVRRATMLVSEKEYTNVKSGGSAAQTQTPKPTDPSANASLRMSSPLAACPGFGNEGTANELLKALAFRREKTLKLEQSWGGQGVIDDLSSAPESDSEEEEEVGSGENLNLTEVS